jgi:hypothetical protein
MGQKAITPIRAAIVSPLLGRALAAAPGAEMVHRTQLMPLDASGVEGHATLTLSPDRATIAVSLEATGIAAGSIQLVHIPAAGMPRPVRRRVVAMPPDSEGQVSLRTSFGPVEEIEEAFDLDTLLGAAGKMPDLPGFVVHGMSVPASANKPAAGEVMGTDGMLLLLSAPKRSAEADYLRHRLGQETRAALRASDPLAASIHVRLATHYARCLSAGAAA